MFGEVYLTNLFKAGLPNAGPMGVEDCLAENIRQNKVKFWGPPGPLGLPSSTRLSARPQEKSGSAA